MYSQNTIILAFYHRYYSKSASDRGFTMTELLVVIIIIGILSALSLPAFVNQAAKAKQSEAKTYIGTVNRGQQAYRTENLNFTDNLSKLALGLEPNTSHYQYTVSLTSEQAIIIADPVEDSMIKGYSGGVAADIKQTIICQTKKQNNLTPVQASTWDVGSQTLICDGNMELMQ